MNTIVLERPGALHLSERPTPGPPPPGHALVRVRRVGICGTDLHAYRGRQPFFAYPRVLGHELGVEIESLGPGTEALGLAPGMPCAVEPYIYCGECSACRRGRTNCCRTLKVLGVHVDGGMCERLHVPAHLLHPSESLSTDALALVEMLCIGAHAVRRAAPQAGEQTLVIGAGPIGLAAAQFARLAHADVAILEVNADRLAFAQTYLGIEKTLVAPATDEAESNPEAQTAAIRAGFGGDLPTLVFDATGNARSMSSAFDWVEQGGRLVFVGLVQDQIAFYDPEFHRREMTLLASRNATREDFASVIRRLESGAVQIDAWITHRSAVDTLVDDFPTWLRPETGVVKAMLSL